MSDDMPSEDLHKSVSKAFVAVAEDLVTWEFVDSLTTPVYTYVQDLLNRSGAKLFLTTDDGAELTLGVAVWDENGDDLLSSNQFPFSDVLFEGAYREDPGMLEALIAATERSLEIARAKLAELEHGS